ncbi:NBR1-Ig-like domain-containing protein [Micromonospora sp. NBC_01638]|uniref:NBR1-Ig-like domain-containing protein n=1 Tax=Micromonospora sp. NBC_01638 TaxID=2975982 RepID=UPI00386D0889|nr:NBR1-Ig-like domain-containing protein [Micromonospora sp. NBC_01638]
MGDRLKDQRAATEAIQDRQAAEGFAEQLRTLRTAAGDPSFRKMAGRSGRISHTTLHEAAAGTRFPSWETTREFVRACEADEVQWRCRWEDAQRLGTVHAIPASLTDAETAITVDGRTTGAGTSDAPDAPAAHGPVGSGVVASSPQDQGALRATEYPQAEDEATGARGHRLPWLAAAATVVVVATVAVVGVAVRGRSSPDGSHALTASPSSTAFSDSLIPGDASKFVGDITVPDGSQVKVNESFDKVWALANVGTVDWHNRYLARTSPTADIGGCQTPDRVPIGDTAPGEQVMIRVRVTAPNRPGKCWVSWKMVDEHGQAYFPTRRPVYFMVTVVA